MEPPAAKRLQIEQLFVRHTLPEIDDYLVKTASKASHLSEDIRLLVGSHSPEVLNTSQIIHSMFELSGKLRSSTLEYGSSCSAMKELLRRNQPRYAASNRHEVEKYKAVKYKYGGTAAGDEMNGEHFMESDVHSHHFAATVERLSDRLMSMYSFCDATPIQTDYVSTLASMAAGRNRMLEGVLLHKFLIILLTFSLTSLPSRIRNRLLDHQFVETIQIIYGEVSKILQMIHGLRRYTPNTEEELAKLLDDVLQGTAMEPIQTQGTAYETECWMMGTGMDGRIENGDDKYQQHTIEDNMFPFNIHKIIEATVSQLVRVPLQIYSFSQKRLSNAFLETNELIHVLAALLVIQVPSQLTMKSFIDEYYRIREDILLKLFSFLKRLPSTSTSLDNTDHSTTITDTYNKVLRRHENKADVLRPDLIANVIFVFESTLAVAYYAFLPTRSGSTDTFEMLQLLKKKAPLLCVLNGSRLPKVFVGEDTANAGTETHKKIVLAGLEELHGLLHSASTVDTNGLCTVLDASKIFYTTLSAKITQYFNKLLQEFLPKLSCSSLKYIWEQVREQTISNRETKILMHSNEAGGCSTWSSLWDAVCEQLCKLSAVDLLGVLGKAIAQCSSMTLQNMVTHIQFDVDNRTLEVANSLSEAMQTTLDKTGDIHSRTPECQTAMSLSNGFLQSLDGIFKFFTEELNAALLVNEERLDSVKADAGTEGQIAEEVHLITFLTALYEHLNAHLKRILTTVGRTHTSNGSTETEGAALTNSSDFTSSFNWLLMGHRLANILDECVHINENGSVNIFTSSIAPYTSRFFRTCYAHKPEIRHKMVSILVKIEEAVEQFYKAFVRYHLSRKLQYCKTEIVEFLEQSASDLHTTNGKFGNESIRVTPEALTGNEGDETSTLWIPMNATASIDKLLISTCQFFGILTEAAGFPNIPKRLLHMIKAVLCEEVAAIYSEAMETVLKERKEKGTEERAASSTFVFHVLFNLYYLSNLLDSSFLPLLASDESFAATDSSSDVKSNMGRQSVSNVLDMVIQKHEQNFLTQKLDKIICLSLIREHTSKAVVKTSQLYAMLLKDNPRYSNAFVSTDKGTPQLTTTAVGLLPVHPQFRQLNISASSTTKYSYSNAIGRANGSVPAARSPVASSTSSRGQTQNDWVNTLLTGDRKPQVQDKRSDDTKSASTSISDRGSALLSRNLQSWLSADPSNINVSVADLSKQVENAGSFLGRHVGSMQNRVTGAIRRRNE